MTMQSINPATAVLIREFEEHSDAEVDERLSRAVHAFEAWREVPMEQRASLMHAAAEVLRGDLERLAGLITDEMGKPIAQSRAEVEKCAWCCDYFADNAASFLADIPSPSSAT